MARLYNWLTDPQRNPKIIGQRLNDEFDNIWGSSGFGQTAYCRAYLAADQTGVASATFTKVNLDTADIDPNSMFSAANKRIIPNVAGTYSVVAGVGCSGSISGSVLVAVAKNGSRIVNSGEAAPSGAADSRPNTSTIVAMNGSTDYVEAQGFITLSSGTGTFSGNIAVTWLYVARVGP